MVEDDHILSESLCLALTKFSGIPQATHIQYAQTGLQQPKNRANVGYTRLFSNDSTVLNTRTCTLCPCVTLSLAHTQTFVPLHTSPPARTPLSLFLSLCSDMLLLSFPFSSRLSSCDHTLFHMMPESRSEGEWGTSLHSQPPLRSH